MCRGAIESGRVYSDREVLIAFSRMLGTIALLAMGYASAFQSPPGQPLELKVAETATVDGLRIAFEGVGEDSRCPTGVQCVWAGDAAAAFALEKPPAAAVHRTLHTSGRFERQTEYEGLVVRLDDIKPYPKDGATIAPGDYRATIVVTRR